MNQGQEKKRNTYITGQGILQFGDRVSCSARSRTRWQAEVRVLKKQNTQNSNRGLRATHLLLMVYEFSLNHDTRN